MLVAILALSLTIACANTATKTPGEEAFQRSMRAMNNVDSYRMEGTFKAFGEYEVARSGDRARVAFNNSSGQNQYVVVPPYLYSANPSDGMWLRSEIEPSRLYDPVAVLLLLGLVIYPHEDIPL